MKEFDYKQNSHNNVEDEIDFKALFSIILHYKKSILFIILMTTIMAFFQAYFMNNIYQSSALIKIVSAKYNTYKDDLVTDAMGHTDNNIDDEIAVLKTRVIAQKSLQNVNIGVRYYTTQWFKKRELYKDSPFVVTVASMTHKAHSMEFILTPIDNKTFTLSIEPSLKRKFLSELRSFFAKSDNEHLVYYHKTHHFGESIETPWFKIKIQKVLQFDENSYAFTLRENASMGWFIQNGLSAALHTKYGNFIALKFIDTVPTRAKEILESVTHTYINDNIKLKTESIQKKIHFINMQLDAINKTLSGSAEELQKYKITNIDARLNASTHDTSTKLGELENELYEISLKTDILDNMFNYLRTHHDIAGIDPYSATLASPSVGNLIQEIHTNSIERTGLMARFTLIHPEVTILTNRIEFSTKRLKDTIVSTLESLNVRKIALKKTIYNRKTMLKKLPKEEQELEQLTRNFLVNENIYAFLLQKRAEIAITESSIVSDIRILEEPIISNSPIGTSPKTIIFIGFILGVILALAIAFIRDFINNTIKTIYDIEKLTDVPIYGALPQFENSKITDHYKESINTLWSNIEFSYIEGNSKVITFTSSVSGEGKTLTVSELAKSISGRNKSVIILDLDMRKSAQHKNYSLPNTKGMSTLLTRKHTLQEVIQDTSYENLHIITGGPRPPNPAELIMSKMLEPVIEKLKERYDYILIDAPPIGLVADARKLMRFSSLTLILFKAHLSKKAYVQNIIRTTNDPKIHKGIVLNGTTKESNSYGYGYGYGYSH
ncbi:MAG: polysaccharide biosynthesis tyrosine autokinase [Campylobacterota bacterium]|nr:polysaccharide biosynthesis tyrosine autokinase [Campylobacterota bacterium]